jgi:hypothetical protein
MSTEKNEQESSTMAATHAGQSVDTAKVCVTTIATTSVVAKTTKYPSVILTSDRDSWSNRVVYLLSIIGFVVDLGR